MLHMHSTASKPSPFLPRLPNTKLINPNRHPYWIIKPNSKPRKQLLIQSPSLERNSLGYPHHHTNSNSPSLPFPQNTQENNPNLKLQSLASEFKSLPEPIDRVKRLLHYAALLPPPDESTRVDSNWVRGCTTQVWLDVRMDPNGLMRFKIDSDSEIAKGFCSCLVWVLDGAEPEEVAAVTANDLADVNVGGFSGGGRARSMEEIKLQVMGGGVQDGGRMARRRWCAGWDGGGRRKWGWDGNGEGGGGWRRGREIEMGMVNI